MCEKSEITSKWNLKLEINQFRLKKIGVETISTINFTNNYKEVASNILN